MEFSLPTKKQWIDFLKATAYVAASNALDYVISQSTGSTYGTLTIPINMLAVFIKKLLTKSK